MQTFKEKWAAFFVISAMVFSLQGCDQISKLINYFSPKKNETAKAAPVPAPVVSQPAVSESPAAAPAPKAETPAAPATVSQELALNVLAKVGNWSITIDEFKNQEKAARDLAQQNNLEYDLPSQRLLFMIVEQQLLFQEAQRQGLDKDATVSKQLDEARKLILSQTLQTKMAGDLVVSDEEVQKFYTDNKAFYYQPAEYKISQIVVDSEAEANDIFSQLAQGANFADLLGRSKIKSNDAFVTEDQLGFPKMRDVLNALDVGKYSTVFAGPEGFYIIKLDAKQGGKELSLDEVKESIIADIKYLKYLGKLEEFGKGLNYQQKSPEELNKLLESK